jgi:hypothetical protein
MIYASLDYKKWQEVYVVFSDLTRIKFLRILKRGFRHCYLILGNKYQWLIIEVTSKRLYIDSVLKEDSPNLLATFSNEKRKVIRTYIHETDAKKIPFDIFSCVSLCKKIIGVNSYKIITPYDLYKFLQNENKLKIT